MLIITKGTIKKIIHTRGFGFIETEDSDEDIFFHYSQLQNARLDELEVGSSVEFEIEETMKGPQAVNVTVG